MKICEMVFFVDDVSTAALDWVELMGLEPEVLETDQAVFQDGDVKYLFHQKLTPGPEDPPAENHIAFASSEIEEDIKMLEDSGYKLLLPTKLYEWGKSAYLRDPAGDLIELKAVEEE